jgi:mRNA interferase MazF
MWWADLPDPWGRRPVVLLARDEAYAMLTWIMVAPVTTNVRDIPTAVVLDPNPDSVPRRSAVMLDSILAIRREWLNRPIGRLRASKVAEIDRAIHFALALRGCR